MKVGIDISRMNSLSKSRGIGFYTKYLYQALKKYTDIEILLIEKETNQKFDVIHYPFFDLFFATLPIKKNVPTVVTIHDVIPLVFSDKYPKGIKGKITLERQKLALKNVKAIITDSQTSKLDIAKHLNISTSRINSIYLAPGEQFKKINDQRQLQKVKNKFNLPKKFALFIGNVNWNKNILNLTEAAIKADIDLYLIGSGFTDRSNLNHPEIKSFVQFLDNFSSHSKVHILGFVDSEEMVNILNLSTVFLFPSFYEGFGLPILEAQACGIPVITSNNSSMLEITKDSAILVNPDSVEEIKDAIIKLDNEEIRKFFIDLGSKNIERFSWETTAKETAKVYEKIFK